MKKQSDIAKKANVKLIEPLENGEWIVRYGFRDTGSNVRFVASQYPCKPTIEQIRRSIGRFLLSIDDYDLRMEISQGIDYADYFAY